METRLETFKIDAGNIRFFLFFEYPQDDNEGLGFDISLIDLDDSDTVERRGGRDILSFQRNGRHLFFKRRGRYLTLVAPREKPDEPK